MRKGREINGNNRNGQDHLENVLALSASEVYLSGRSSQHNLDVLVDMSERNSLLQDSSILFPGISLVYQNESDCLSALRKEHQSRTALNNVVFKVLMDLEIGQPNYREPEKYFGSLKTCFNLERLMDEDPRFRGQALVSRLYAQVESHYTEQDPVTEEPIHYFVISQIHSPYELIMDW